MKYQQKNVFFIIQVITILGFLILPFYLFGGKLFIGGDDSRLFYIFPWEWMKNIAFYSWFHFSTGGSNNPNQFILPFLFVWSGIGWLIKSPVILDYLAFSLPLILGFIFFQALCNEFIEDKNNSIKIVIYAISLFYTLSPIVATNQLSVFLYSVWLIGLLPLIIYFFVKYLKTGDFLYVFINLISCVLLSFSVSAIPWLLGFFLPLVIALFIIIPFYTKKEIRKFIIRSVIFYGVLIFSQGFWIYSFAANILLPEKNSFLSTALSSGTSDTFTETVLATANGNSLYPILNLFHRQLSVDYDSPLKNIFLFFYDKTILFDSLYVILFFIALLNFKRFLNKSEIRYYLFVFISFLLSLFFFSVNIGPLKNIFLLMGHLPGFVMFRNYYDKFALGYTLIYSILLTLSLVIVVRRFNKYSKIIIGLTLLVIFINIIPIKAVVNKVLWTTKDIYTVITIPNEYVDFMSQVQNTIPQTSNILSLPFNIAGYTIIKDNDSNNVFAGRSPVQLFTGINDFSGNLSFSPATTDRFIKDIKQRNYKDLNEFLVERNINYIFVTNNIPNEVIHSYLFDKKVLPLQDDKFLKAITGNKVLVSKNRNYILYSTKYPTSIFQSPNIQFKKINPVTYKLYLDNIKSPQQLVFLDAFSGGWKLYPEIYNVPMSHELSYLFRKDIYSKSHQVVNDYSNQWTIDPTFLKQNYNQSYYHTNSDGSLNMILTLFFKPQEYFYIGSLFSLSTILISLGYLIYSKRRKKQ